jgi:catechol 2,3-dioxygenase-like lactoylglutathione lyase family enzyme
MIQCAKDAVPRILDSRLVLAVRDLKTSTRFYVDVLGFTHHAVDADGWSFLSRDTFTVMLGECADEKPASQLGDHSYVGYLIVDNVDRLRDEWFGLGATVSAPADKPWGLREFTLRTPDGHRFTIGERLLARPPE